MAEWNEQSILSNFRNLRGGQFDDLRAMFALSLSDEQLTACALHCALVLRRDPTVGELLLWDRLAQIPYAMEGATVTALETQSAALAKTYADMMAKRRELCKNPAPLSLQDAFSLASDALERGGKDRGLRAHTLRLTNALSAPFAKDGIAEQLSPAFLSVFKTVAAFAPEEPGDLCLLVQKRDCLSYAYESILSSVLENEALQTKLHDLFPVTKSGLLPALLSHFEGFEMDLSRLSEPSDSFAELLTKRFAGDMVLVLSRSAVAEVLEQLRARGITGTVFARLTGQKKVVFLGNRKLEEQADFLRSLFLLRPGVSVTLEADAALCAPVSLASHSRYPCRFLPFEHGFSQSATVCGLAASAASTPVTAGAFPTAVLTALAPILACALAGVDYSDARLAVDLTLPSMDLSTFSNAFAAAIGLYRVQAELGIPAAQTRIAQAETDVPKLSVFALGKGARTPAGTWAEAGSKIYLVPIPLSAEGLPDFEELRRRLADFAAQANHGVIRSARVVLQKTPKAVLNEMKNTELIAKVKRSVRALKEPLALGVLLESVYEMPFDCVATVIKRNLAQKPAAAEPQTTEIPEQYRIPEGNGLVWRPAPEVVILAPKNNPDAQALALYLQTTGAAVTVFTLAEKDRFLRAVLTASVVYRFPGIRLPRDSKTAFALSVLRQNGGEVRFLKKYAQKK